MRVDDFLCYRQSETGTAGLGGARLLDAVETLEQMRQILGGDADSVVGYSQLDAADSGFRRKLYLTAVRSVFYRVRHDVDYDLLNPLLVGDNLGQRLRHERQLVRMRGGLDLHDLADVPQRGVCVEFLYAPFRALVVEPRQHEQIRDYARHAVALVDRHVQKEILGLGRHIAVGEYRLARALDAGQRSAHLVRHIGDEFAAGLVKLIAPGLVVYDREDTGVRLIVSRVAQLAEIHVKHSAVKHYVADAVTVGRFCVVGRFHIIG